MGLWELLFSQFSQLLLIRIQSFSDVFSGRWMIHWGLVLSKTNGTSDYIQEKHWIKEFHVKKCPRGAVSQDTAFISSSSCSDNLRSIQYYTGCQVFLLCGSESRAGCSVTVRPVVWFLAPWARHWTHSYPCVVQCVNDYLLKTVCRQCAWWGECNKNSVKSKTLEWSKELEKCYISPSPFIIYLKLKSFPLLQNKWIKIRAVSQKKWIKDFVFNTKNGIPKSIQII